MGDSKHISVRQMIVMLFVALLSPAIRVIPRHTAAIAGEAAWIAPLIALVPFVALLGVFAFLFRNRKAGEGLAEIFFKVYGCVLGRAIALVYFLWIFLYLCIQIRLYGERLLIASYRNDPAALFLVVTLALALVVARGKLGAFARVAEIFFLLLTVVIGVIFVFAVPNVRAENLLPVAPQDAGRIARSAFPVLTVLCSGAFAAFLGASVSKSGKACRRAVKWTIAFCLTITGLQIINIGALGPGLTANMQRPFFAMIKGINIFHTIERIDPVVLSLWVLTDFVMITLLFMICGAILKSVFRLGEEHRFITPLTFMALVGSILVAGNVMTLEQVVQEVVYLGNAILVFGGLPITAAVGKLRRKLG